jgi:DNA-binding CsgD family transcriptional regulator
MAKKAKEPVKLSPREKQVARRVGKSMTVQEIADDLGLSYDTVKKYLDRVRDKLGLRRKTEIALWAIENLSRKRKTS